VEILAKYYFEIKRIKRLNNTKANIFNKKEELQSSNKVSGALLKLRENGKI